MADKGFPLPGSSYRELIKIIQGYGTVGADVTPSDVARVVSVHETIVSKNNKFLVAIGIIQGGKKKSITPLGSELSQALHHDIKDEIVSKWRTVVEANDFLQKVVAAVRIRKGMDESTLESHVAYSAGQPKTPAVATGAAAVVDILRAAEVLTEEGGNLVAIAPEAPIVGVSDYNQGSYATNINSSAIRVGSIRSQILTRTDRVSLNIDVRIQCTADDIEELGPKIRKLITELNRIDADDSSNPESGEGQ